ncbi:hypothetical protein N1F78_14315 [Seonamhaeicola sp. MEBiC1930]|uniref:hypothetical protein n=1 Tax=Seonamhaeicola sp. MEBiC01930 TaxID=2976768 RepID=UPI00324880AC
MNTKKNILSFLFLLMTSSVVFAQNNIDSQINNLIKRDNIMLTESDKNLELSKEQINKAKEIYKGMILYENKASKSERKSNAFMKKMAAKLVETKQAIKSLLTPEQLSVYNAYGAK